MFEKREFDVHPRYTAGSPAWVSARIGLQVAREEREAHQRALSGVYGPEAQQCARDMGLRGIVEHHTVMAHKIRFIDLLTGDIGEIKNGKRTVTGNRPDLVLSGDRWP